jgi:hypothetical protein
MVLSLVSRLIHNAHTSTSRANLQTIIPTLSCRICMQVAAITMVWPVNMHGDDLYLDLGRIHASKTWFNLEDNWCHFRTQVLKAQSNFLRGKSTKHIGLEISFSLWAAWCIMLTTTSRPNLWINIPPLLPHVYAQHTTKGYAQVVAITMVWPVSMAPFI